MANASMPSESGPAARRMHALRKPAVAGTWYPDSPDVLAAEVDGYLAAADPAPPLDDLVALVAPHAGLMYSGPVAAYAYRQLRGRSPKLIVLVGPSHFVGFCGATARVRHLDAMASPLLWPCPLPHCGDVTPASL